MQTYVNNHAKRFVYNSYVECSVCEITLIDQSKKLILLDFILKKTQHNAGYT